MAWHAQLNALHVHCQPNTLQQTDAGRRIHNATHAAGDFIKLYWANMTQANKELFGHVNEFVAGSFSALSCACQATHAAASAAVSAAPAWAAPPARWNWRGGGGMARFPAAV